MICIICWDAILGHSWGQSLQYSSGCGLWKGCNKFLVLEQATERYLYCGAASVPALGRTSLHVCQSANLDCLLLCLWYPEEPGKVCVWPVIDLFSDIGMDWALLGPAMQQVPFAVETACFLSQLGCCLLLVHSFLAWGTGTQDCQAGLGTRHLRVESV